MNPLASLIAQIFEDKDKGLYSDGTIDRDTIVSFDEYNAFPKERPPGYDIEGMREYNKGIKEKRRFRKSQMENITGIPFDKLVEIGKELAGDDVNEYDVERLANLGLAEIMKNSRAIDPEATNILGEPTATPEVRAFKENAEKLALLDDDEPEAKKGFFQSLKDAYNDPKNKQTYDNIALSFAQKATAPLDPGENRGLLNTAIDSVVEGKALTSKQQTAAAKAALDLAKAKKEIEGDKPTSYKEAVRYVTEALGLKEGMPGYTQELGKAMRAFGIKDLTTSKVNAFRTLIDMEQQLALIKDVKDPDYIRIKKLIDRLVGTVFADQEGGSGSLDRDIVPYYN